MRFIPQKENNAPTVISGLCIFAAAVCLLLSGAPYMPRGILQVFAVAFIVACVQITQRFILTSYEYELTDTGLGGSDYYDGDILTGGEEFHGGGRYDFAVIMVQGRRRRTVCSLTTADLYAVYRDGKKNRAEYEVKLGKTTLVYNYRRNLFPQNPLVCVFEQDDKLVEIRLECDESFESALLVRVKEK